MGHSWGTLVGHQIAKRMNGKVKSFVTLDTATDFDGAPIHLINNQLDTLEYDFRDIAEYSVSFEGSLSGSDARAVRADDSVKIVSPGIEQFPGWDQLVVEHGQVVDVFSNLISDVLEDNVPIAKYFELNDIRNGISPINWTLNTLQTSPAHGGEGFEALLEVDYNSGDPLLRSFQYKNSDGIPIRELSDGTVLQDNESNQSYTHTLQNSLEFGGWIGGVDDQDVYSFSLDSSASISLESSFDVAGLNLSNIELLDENGNIIEPSQSDSSIYNLSAGTFSIRIKRDGTALLGLDRDYWLRLTRL